MAIKRNSILIKFFVSMMAVLLLQATVILVAVFAGRVLESLNDTAVNLFSEKVASRTQYVERELVERWRNISGSDEAFSALTAEVCARERIEPWELNNHPDGNILPATQEILENGQDELIALLRRTTATGAFLMFTGGQQPVKFGLYVRNADPRSNLSSNLDLQLEVSPLGFYNKYGIPMASTHDTVFDSDNLLKSEAGEYRDFYARPLRTFSENPNYSTQDCGYWSARFTLNNRYMPVITYTVPLAVEGKVFALLGMEFTETYLKSFMPFTELDGQGNGGYVMGYAITESGGVRFENITGSGAVIDMIVGGDVQHMLSSQKLYSEGVYRFNDKDNKTNFLAAASTVKIYNTNTPMDNVRFCVAGVLDEKIVFANATAVTFSMTMALVASLLVSIVIIFLFSYFFSRPIMKLTASVSAQPPGERLALTKVNISEIDNLTAALEKYNEKFLDTVAKMSKIIDVAGMPIAAFEFTASEHDVFYTDKFFEILGKIPPMIRNADSLAELLRGIDNAALEKTQDGDIYTFNYSDDYGALRWVELTLIENADKTTGVLRDVTRERLEKQKLEYERDYDLLTEIYNRRAFSAKAAELFNGKLVNAAVVLIDIDNLKYINDTYGHDYGDEYIRLTADVLKSFSGPHGLVARMAGDEFYVLFYNFISLEAIQSEVSRLEYTLSRSEMRLPDGKRVKLRVSAGVSWYPADSRQLDELVRFADFAMYEIKTTKKGVFHNFEADSYGKKAYLLKSKEDLNELIEKKLVEYCFQPIVRADSGEIFGYEALMRPTHPAFDSPTEVLELAKAQYKLELIESLTWERAMRAFDENKQAVAGKKVFINSIANQILPPDDIELLQDKYPHLLSGVIMEITESERNNIAFSQKKSGIMRSWGAEIALDDFGTGYSSESVLLELEPQYVKIDMSLIRGINADAKRRSLVANTLAYARERGIKTIAEGVETENELRELIELGVDFLQGYYIARPQKIPGQLSQRVTDKIVAMAGERHARGQETELSIKKLKAPRPTKGGKRKDEA